MVQRDNYRTGDEICMFGEVIFGLASTAIKGYIEQINGDRIKINIASTSGGHWNYNGVELKEGTTLWDDKFNWGYCK